MTARTRTTDATTVHAGTPEELASIADAYARGDRTRPPGHDQLLFRQAAAQLRDGARAVDLGSVRFYTDRVDGAPFHGPHAPEPDPEWLARQQSLDGQRRT